MRRFFAAACVATVMLSFAACRDRSSVQDHQDKLCVELSKLDASVTKLAALTPSASSGAQVRQIRSDMASEYKNVQDAAKDVGSFKIDGVTKAYNDVLASFRSVNDQTTLAAAHDQIDKAAGEFSDARLQLNTTAGC